MKRFLILAATLMLLCFTLAFAAEKTPAVRSPRVRTPEMSAAGKVIEVSDTGLKIERVLKGEVETMEFFLEKPFPNVVVGEQIKASYREKDGRNILIRVLPAKITAVRKPKKAATTAPRQQTAPVAK
ncbi:MAG: hypothetical protein ACYDAA_13300 [Syntrophales bacterium]